mgnify:CR=1 FL=1
MSKKVKERFIKFIKAIVVKVMNYFKKLKKQIKGNKLINKENQSILMDTTIKELFVNCGSGKKFKTTKEVWDEEWDELLKDVTVEEDI